MRDEQGFDEWAHEYNESVILSDDSEKYPFAGYGVVMDEIFQHATAGMERVGSGVDAAAPRRILDIGFGTGVLASRLYDAGCDVWGQDFSSEMIAIAQEKMPHARLYKADFNQGLAAEIEAQRFDYIVATYSLHHLPVQKRRSFLAHLLSLLEDDGCILVGDIAFGTRAELERCKAETGDAWDPNEVYFTYEEIALGFPGKCSFRQLSPCAGLFIFTK